MIRPWALHLLRGTALLVALAAAIDPAVTSSRVGRPTIAVTPLSPAADSALAARVTQQLGERFTIVPGPFAGADATVLVGNGTLSPEMSLTPALFAVVPGGGAQVAIEHLEAPAASALQARVPVTARLHVTGGKGRTVEATLGTQGMVVDRFTASIVTDDTLLTVSLGQVPVAAGSVGLRFTARFAGDAASEQIGDLAVDVVDHRWAVLFYDPRPSWMSTFVRRALEDAPAFVVTSRVVTSTNLSTDAGTPPNSLDNLVAMDLYDVVVVGAPAALSDRDVAGLDAFLRRRGGQVMLLLDERADGPWQRLIGAPAWREDSSRVLSLRAVDGDSAGLRATEIAWPVRLPAAAEALALSDPLKGDSATRHPVIWRTPVGAGAVTVSGALDSWSFRDPGLSGFTPFWQRLVAQAAATAMPPVSVTVTPSLVRPREPVELRVTVRDPSLRSPGATSAIHGTISATLEHREGGNAIPVSAIPVPLWPAGAPGEFVAQLRAPADSGTWQLTVRADGSEAVAPFVVRHNAIRADGTGEATMRAVVAAHGGAVITADRLGELPKLLLGGLQAAPRPERWHPLRSLWWLLPFALCLSAEWWLRRQRGLP